MARIDITDIGLTVTLIGARRVVGRIRPLTIPWHNVSDARLGSAEARRFPGIRWGVSSYIPGILALGSFRTLRTRDFWDVTKPVNAIVVELTGHKYDRLIIEVDDPQATVAAITAVVSPRRCDAT